MKRTLLVLLAAGLAVAPAAAAKGPHVILTTPREFVQPGKPWLFTVELNEFRGAPRPAMTGRLGPRTVGAHLEKTPSSIDGATAYRVAMIFPKQGHWELRLYAGKHRFAFPAVDVGGAWMPQDYVAFPVGSGMEGEGGDFSPNQAAGGEETGPADPPVAKTEGDGGMGAWVLPLLGVALAGAGVAAVTRRGSR
jgi:hypothetical protein